MISIQSESHKQVWNAGEKNNSTIQILPYSFCEEPQSSKPKNEIYALQNATHEVHFLAVTTIKISQGLKCTSRIWKSAVIGLHKFQFVSADICRGGKIAWQVTRMSAQEANWVAKLFEIIITNNGIMYFCYLPTR